MDERPSLTPDALDGTSELRFSIRSGSAISHGIRFLFSSPLALETGLGVVLVKPKNSSRLSRTLGLTSNPHKVPTGSERLSLSPILRACSAQRKL